MPWTPDDQKTAQATADAFMNEFETKWAIWVDVLKSGLPGTIAQAAVEDVVTRWQKFLNQLQTDSNTVAADESTMDALSQLALQVVTEKATLAKLRSEAGTRDYQADSVNPKVRGSPYTNVLGLQRTFRSSTKSGILAASIVFGVLAIGSLGFLTYQVVTTVSKNVA